MITDVDGNPGETKTSYLFLDNPAPVQGWTLAICHDDTIADVVAIHDGTEIAFANNGSPADFVSTTMLPDGWIGSVIVDIFSTNMLPAANVNFIHQADYAFVGTGSASVCFCDNALGNPPVVQQILTAGMVIQPDLDCAPAAPFDDVFRRGDVNGDGVVSIADPIRMLGYLYANGLPITCPDTADVNDDSVVNLADAVYLLAFLFQAGAGAPPLFPGPAVCGPDYEIDFLADCVYTGC